MCMFMSTADLPTDSGGKGGQGGSNQFIKLFLKPNKENEQYRLRLLFYLQPSKNNRKEPYICQQVHEHWGVNDSGKKIVDDTVVCPRTKHVQYDEDKFVLNPKKGKKELNCPICRKASEAFGIRKASGWKDKVAAKRYTDLKAKFMAAIPVYVINDPNNEKNNNKLKVLILTNKDEFEMFDKLVKEEKAKAYLATKEGNGYEVFNGTNAVDFYLRMENVPVVRNEGKPNEYTATVRKITKMAFGKRHDQNIPSITKEAIDAFPFDDQFYTSNTKAEIEAFYKKYFGQNDVTLSEDEDVFSNDPTPAAPAEPAPPLENASAPKVEPPSSDVESEELDDLIGGDDVPEAENEPTTASPGEADEPKTEASDDGDIDLDALLNEVPE